MKSNLYQSASRRFYKPTATRTPVLILLLIFTVSLFVLTEIACRNIPAHPGIGKLGNVVDEVLSQAKNGKRSMEKRQFTGSITQATALSTSGLYLQPREESTVTTNTRATSTPTLSGIYSDPGNGPGVATPTSVSSPTIVTPISYETASVSPVSILTDSSSTSGPYLQPGKEPVETTTFSTDRITATSIGGSNYLGPGKDPGVTTPISSTGPNVATPITPITPITTNTPITPITPITSIIPSNPPSALSTSNIYLTPSGSYLQPGKEPVETTTFSTDRITATSIGGSNYLGPGKDPGVTTPTSSTGPNIVTPITPIAPIATNTPITPITSIIPSNPSPALSTSNIYLTPSGSYLQPGKEPTGRTVSPSGSTVAPVTLSGPNILTTISVGPLPISPTSILTPISALVTVSISLPYQTPAGAYLTLGEDNTVTSTATSAYLTPGGPSKFATQTTLTAIGEFTTSGYLTQGTGKPTGPSPTLIMVNGQISTLASGGIATDANGSPLPILTSMDGQTFAVTPQVTIIEAITYTQTPELTVFEGNTLLVTPVVTSLGSVIFTETPYMTVVSGETYVLTPAVTTFGGVTYTEFPVVSITGDKTYEVTPYITTSGRETTIRTPTPSGTTRPSNTFGDTPATAMKAIATIVNSTGTFYTWSNHETTVATQISYPQYIYVSFLPLILAVLFTVPWRILDSTIREMEPFYQLHQHGGSLGKNSLCLDYSTSFLITIPFKSISHSHFIPFWSSLISLAVLVLAPLSSEAFFVSIYGDCDGNATSTFNCRAAWGVYPVLARTIEGILAFIMVLLMLIIVYNYRRTSGVYSDPLSITGLAVLLSKSPMLSSLRQIDSMVSNEELRGLLEKGRFILSSFVAADQTKCHGIILLDMESEAGFASSWGARDKNGKYKPVHSVDEVDASENELEPPSQNIINWDNKSWFWADLDQKAIHFATFLIIAGLLTLITYYHYTSGSTRFEIFMDSQTFGPRFLMSVVGVGIKLLWSNIDSDTRRTTPFSSLIQGSSTPQSSILVPFYASPVSAIFPSLRRKHFLLAYISFLSILSEFLPILLANIPFSRAMTQLAYNICNFISMALLSLMVIAVVILIARKPTGIGSLPRRPGSGGIASTALYLSAPSEVDESEVVGIDSRERGFLDGLDGLAIVTGRERDDAVIGLGSLYSLGVVDTGNARSAGERKEELRIDDDKRVRRLLCE